MFHLTFKANFRSMNVYKDRRGFFFKEAEFAAMNVEWKKMARKQKLFWKTTARG